MSDIPLIRVENLWKVFEKGGQSIEVLRGASLDIWAGEVISIVGQSGSGKSTFLHLLGVLDRPSKGKIWVEGQDVFSLPSAQIDALRNRTIGFVFQFHHLLLDQSALFNVMMPMLIGGESMKTAQNHAEDLLNRVGLSNRAQHRPSELSGGEQQRVAIARAMICKPQLLLADEPTGNLDPRTAADIMGLLLQLHEETGGALVIVTHDHELAARAPRMLTLTEGRFLSEERC
jgi:lipoprotein-releasing system ATP-binding protein